MCFRNKVKYGPFNGVISEFSLGTDSLIDKYKDFELQLTFLKVEVNNEALLLQQSGQQINLNTK